MSGDLVVRPGSADGPGRPDAPGAPALRVRGVSRRFGAVRALDDVDLQVQAGEVVALVGENGSGKSTLSRIVAGALAMDSGTVEVDGVAQRFVRPRDALDAGVAMVGQEPTGVPGMSLAENVLLPRLQRLARLVDRRRLAAEARPYLRRVGLDEDPAAPLRTLPPGRRELVEVARALATHPRVLVLDEVTTRLPDPEQLFAVVEAELGSGLAVLLVTHRLREIRRLAHRAVVLRDGRVVAHLGAGQLSDEQVSSAMVGRELGAYHARRDVVPGPVVLRLDGVVTDRSPHPLSLQVRAGEVVGLAGLVGSGRSEVLETVAGARRRRAGTVRVGSRLLPGGSTRAAAAAGVALVPEDRLAQALVAPASVAANLVLAEHRWDRLAHAGRERARARAAVTGFGIRCGAVDVPVAQLSGGNAQKVVLARCLDREPTVLLLDEPTRGVDVGARADIYELVGRLVERGGAVLLASSDLLELLGLSDRVLVLHDGELVGELDREQASEEAVALLAAGGRRMHPSTSQQHEGAPA